MNTTDFSVLIPVYKKEDPVFFDIALASIEEQTYLPKEIVIVEDGPLTEALYNTIDKHSRRFPDLYNIVKLPVNKGMGEAMNIGLQNCKYEWVARMDSDDIAKKDRFEKQIGYLQQHPDLDALGSFIEEFNTTPGDIGKIRTLPLSHEEIEKFAKKRNPINHMSVIYRRNKAIEAGGYWDYRIFEDYNLWYQMLRRGCKFSNLPEVLLDVRTGNNMIARRSGLRYFKGEYKFFKQMKQDRFISMLHFMEAITIRFISRMLPKVVLEKIYNAFLRNNRKVPS